MPSTKLYAYTTYYANGKVGNAVILPKLSVEDLKDFMGGNFDIVPRQYYAKQRWARGTVFVNEEQQDNRSAPVNQFFDNLGDDFIVRGNAVLQAVHHG